MEFSSLAGETLYGLAKQHDLSRNLIRIGIAKHEAGALDSDTAAADMLAKYDPASRRWSGSASSRSRTSF